MRRYAILVGASMVGIYAGCSSDPSNTPFVDDGSEQEAGVPGVPGDSGAEIDGAVVRPDGSVPGPVDAGPDAEIHAEGFDPDFTLPGLSGTLGPSISSMAQLVDRQIVAGGNFERAGDADVKRIAIWNGAKWTPIGNGFASDVVKVTVNATTKEIYAVTREEFPTFKLHKWNNVSWSELGAFDGEVRSLEVTSSGILYAAGTFRTLDGQPLQGLARYDGTTWSTVGTPPRSLYAFRMIANEPCIGGKIGESDSVGVACFDGTEWKAREANMATGTIHALREQGGQMIAAGRFALKDANGQPESIGSLARWTGAAWELVGGGLSGAFGPADVSEIAIDGTKIYAVGTIARVGGGTNVSGIAMYDSATSQWSDVGGGFSGSTAATPGPSFIPAKTLAVVTGGEVFAGGGFSIASGRSCFGIARWDKNLWNPVDQVGAKRLGVNGKTMAAAVGPDGSFYAGGTFGLVGTDVGANNIARFKDGVWHPLANGIAGAVWTLEFTKSGTELYAGGAFGGAGNVTASNVAKWNGTAWSALGAGLDRAVSILKVGPDGNLYAGGEFTKSGDVTVNRVAVWNGVSWSPLGDGFADGRVANLTFGPDGKLYAGGTFKKSGAANVKGIAVWDGTTWTAVGGGVEGQSTFAAAGVYDIVFYDGKLTISGQFTKQSVMPDGGVAPRLNNVAVLDGATWVSLGPSGLPSRSASSNSIQARRMAIHGKNLYVAGILELLGTTSPDGGAPQPVKHVAKWDGTTWSEVGGGVSDAVDEIVSTDKNLWLVGSFTWAGNHGSDWIARYWYGN